MQRFEIAWQFHTQLSTSHITARDHFINVVLARVRKLHDNSSFIPHNIRMGWHITCTLWMRINVQTTWFDTMYYYYIPPNKYFETFKFEKLDGGSEQERANHQVRMAIKKKVNNIGSMKNMHTHTLTVALCGRVKWEGGPLPNVKRQRCAACAALFMHAVSTVACCHSFRITIFE